MNDDIHDIIYPDRKVFDEWATTAMPIFENIDGLVQIQSLLVSSSVPPFTYTRYSRLFRLIDCLWRNCQQINYAMKKLEFHVTQYATNVYEFYVSYYLYDFLSRIKTSTDIVALLIKEALVMEIDDKLCSLENGQLAKALKNVSFDNVNCTRIAKILDSERTKWLHNFDKLRDHTVHRAALEFMGMGMEDHKILIALPLPKNPRFALPKFTDVNTPRIIINYWKRVDILIEFLIQIKSSSQIQAYHAIDPIVLCEEIWSLFCSSVNSVLKEIANAIKYWGEHPFDD